MDIDTITERLDAASAAWKLFQEDKPFTKDTSISPAVYQSWVKSRGLGVSMAEDTFKPVTTADKSLVNQSYADYTVFLHDRYSSYFHKGERLLTKFGGVGLWMDSNLQVFHKIGDSELIDQLRIRNIKYGTSFKQERIGTNAVSMADKANEGVWLIGDENYHQALKDYVTCSTARMKQGYIEGFMMLVFPIEGFDETKIQLADFLLESFFRLYNDHERIEHASHDVIIKMAMKRTGSLYFLCDSLGRLIEADEEFYQVMRLNPLDASAKRVDSILTFDPPISKYFTSTKESLFRCTIKEPRFKTEHHYTFESYPISLNGSENAGTLFILTSSQAVNSFIKKMSKENSFITFNQIIGSSQKFHEAIHLAKTASNGYSSILIRGESGTGKELFAQAIHSQRFPNNDRPFVAINCGCLPRDLLNSELFGYVEGAFTGAKKGGAPGKFELANGGTLFLDEIGEMPLDMQAALLRVLEDKAVTRVGGSTRIPVDVRILSATNKDLLKMIQEGTFRLDLYYRLNVITIHIPRLAERENDVLVLANHFIQDFAEKLGKHIVSMSDEYEQALLAYDWPGNVRELKNVIERSVNLEDGPLLTDCEFIKQMANEPHQVSSTSYATLGTPAASGTAYNDYASSNFTDSAHAPYTQDYAGDISSSLQRQNFEKQQIKDSLFRNKGNKSKVAVELGISRKTLYNKMHKYGLEL